MPSKPSAAKTTVKSTARAGKTPMQAVVQLPEDCPRTVRPRQLHINDKLRVVYSSNPAGNSTEDAAFLEWLSGHEGQSLAAPARSARIAVVGHTFKPIPASLEAPELQHASAAAAASQSAAQQDARQPIVTPSFVNVQIAQDQDALGIGKSAYIRYVVPTPDDQEATVEYDLDEEDEEWLQKHNSHTKQKLSEDDLERLIDALEKVHHAEIQKHPEQWANLIGSPLMASKGKGKGKGSASQGLQLPDVDSVLPLDAALQSLPDQQPAAVRAVYQHWCQKRHGSDRPLLQRLWYEPPWHRLTVAGSKGSMKDAVDSEEDLVPFSGQDDRRPLRARKTMKLQDVDAVLREMRDDLEQARILADQVQHREKLRKRAMLSWQQNMRQLAGRAIALDKQKAGSAPPGTSKAQPASVKKALSSFEELAESEDGMRAKFEHDMALSLQLTGSVAEEASKLQHVKIIRAEPSQPTLASDSAALGPSRSHSADDSAGDTPAAAAGLTDATTAGSLHSSPQQGLLQSPPRMTRSMPAQMPDANRTDPAVDHSAREANQSPEGSARYASPRLTRSMQSQLKDSEPEAAALNSAGKTPAAPRSDGKTPAPTEGSQLRSRGGSLQLTSPRLKSLQDPLRDPEHLPAATEGSHLQSPGGSLQLTSPRLTRAMQAQLANANNLPALVSRSTGGEEPRAAGSPNTRRHSAGLPAGPSDISQGALTSSPAAASSKRDPAAHSQSKIQQSITKNQQLLASHSRKGHLSAYQQAGSGSSSKAVRFANSPVDVLHPDDSSSSQHEAQQTAAHVTVCEADGNLVEHMSDQQQQSVRQTRSHTTHSSAQAAPQSASGSHHKHASSNKALSPVHQTRLAASKAVTTSNSPNLPSAGLLEVAPSTVPTAAAPHATLALGQTRSGVTFAPLVASQNAAASITSAGTMPARSLHQLQQQAHPLSNRQADADIGAVVGLDTTAAMPNAAAASLQGSAQPHQRHCLHSGRPTREHSQEKNKTVRRTVSPRKVSPLQHSIHSASPPSGQRRQSEPSTAHQQLLPYVNTRQTTVDRGCDPISFSECHESDSEHEAAEQSGRATAKGKLSRQEGRSRVDTEQPEEPTAPSCSRCRQGVAKHAADNLPRSKGIKRRMEVSPLANDSRRVSRRLNPGDTSTAPRTRAAANAGASVQQPSTNAKSMHPIAAAPKPSAAQNRQTVLWSEQNRGKQIPHDQLVPRQTRLTSVAGRAETDAEAASRSGQKPMTGVTEAADATRHDAASDAATLKSRDASGKFLKGKPDGTNHRTAGAAGQGSLAPASGPDRSARNNRQGTLVPASGQCTLASASGQGTLASAVGQGRSAAKQAADKIAKRSALTSKVKSKVKSNRPSVQLAVAKPAAKTSPGKQAQQRHHAAASTRAVAARAVAANGPGVADRGANHAAGAAEKVPAAGVDAASLKALQQAAIAGKLGCPKCRYAQPGCKKCRSSFLKQDGGPAIPRSCMPDARALGFTQLHPAQPSVLMSANVNGAIGKAAAPATSQQAGSEASKEAAGAQMPAASGAGSGKKRKQQQAVQHPSAKKQKTAPVTLQQLSPNKHIATAGTKGKQAVVPILATSALQQRLPSGSKAASNAGNTPSVAQARQAASINATQAKHEQQGQKLAPIAGSLSSKHAQHVTARRLSQQSHDLRTHNKVVAAADRPTASARRSRLSVQGLPNTQQPASHPKTASSRAKPSSAAASKPSTAGKVMSLVAASAKHPEASKVASVPAQSTPTQSNPALSTRGKSLPAQSAKPSTVSKAEPNPVKAGKPLSAARIKTSKVGAAASAAGQAAAEALESKLGCSKCRYVPSGCIRCRAKQAGQLTAGKPSAKRR